MQTYGTVILEGLHVVTMGKYIFIIQMNIYLKNFTNIELLSIRNDIIMKRKHN